MDVVGQCAVLNVNKDQNMPENVVYSQAAVSDQHWLYTAIGILRTLFLKQDDPAKWSHVEKLMDHWEERCQDQSIVMALKGIHAFFTKKLDLDWISQDDVNHVFG